MTLRSRFLRWWRLIWPEMGWYAPTREQRLAWAKRRDLPRTIGAPSTGQTRPDGSEFTADENTRATETT